MKIGNALLCALTIVSAAACERDLVEPNTFVRREAGVPSPPGMPPPDAAPTVDALGPPPPARDAGAPPPVSADAGAGPRQPPQDPECDLAGRWLVAQRVLATAIGQEQAAHNWYYYEVSHQGLDVVVTRGLHCGFQVVKKTSLSAAVDSSGAWPALLERNSSAGRKGTFVKDPAGCRLELEREYTVRGATIPHYADPSTKLPQGNQPATASSPGWEDWDGDGNPGISLKVSSAVASGTLYTCQRDWTHYRGTTAAGAAKFKVSITYGGEQVALGRSPGSPQAITSTSSPSSAAAEHYAWFHRLAPGQATGSDAEICAAVRTLKDMLVPEAGQ